MRKKLSLELRRELLTRTAEDYASARKGIKSQIVDQLVAATGYGRKYAITLLNNPPSGVSSSRPRRARYDERVKRPLVTLWTTANRICAKRLVPFLPELIEVMERNGHLSLPADVRAKLLTISSAPADRLLATERSNQRGVSTTRPGSLLKKQIKVRTFADWDDLQPGDQRRVEFSPPTIRIARFFRADLDHGKHGYKPADQETDEIAEKGKDVDDGRCKSGHGAEYGTEVSKVWEATERVSAGEDLENPTGPLRIGVAGSRRDSETISDGGGNDRLRSSESGS